MSFKEEYLFTKYKESPIKGAKIFKSELSEYKDVVDLGKLYVRIVNYQVKKYGKSLTIGVCEKKTLQKLSDNAYKRRKSQRKARGIEKSAKIERWTDYE